MEHNLKDKTMPRLEQIEAYFNTYSDVPREVIIKEDLLNLGHWFTDAALEAARGTLVKSYRLFSYDLMEMKDMKRKEERKVPEWFYIYAGMYDLRPIGIQTTLSMDSPYVVDIVDGQLMLTLNGISIAQVAYPHAPKYYEKRFPGGVSYNEIIAFGYFVTTFRGCQYWGDNEECKFCDINENIRQMRESRSFTLNAPVKSVDEVLEVANEISRDLLAEEGHHIPLGFLITGGTITKKLHGEMEDKFYFKYVQALKWDGPRRYIILQTNAKDKETLKRYRSEGLDSHHANMEVWDRRLFEWINPGKARTVGWEKWVERIIDSVDVFGEGNVRPNFVCGVEMARPYGFTSVDEAVSSTTSGAEFLISHGVSPRFNHWRREPRSYLVRSTEQPPVPLDFYIKLMRNIYELGRKYGLSLPKRPIAVKELRYMGATHGTYDDYPLLMEASYYKNPLVRDPESLLEIAQKYRRG